MTEVADGMAEDETHVIDDAEIDAEPLDAAREARNDTILAPVYAKATPSDVSGGRVDFHRVGVPQHRRTPLRTDWERIYTPIVQFLHLQIRYNTRLHAIELKTSSHTTEVGAMQKAIDFLRAYMLGFAVDDALALLRLDDLYLDSFMVEDVKFLSGDNLSRAIGRVSGKDGRAKFTIENVTRTRIVLADRRVHILGSFVNIKLARDAICDLVIGSPINKIYARLQTLSGRINTF